MRPTSKEVFHLRGFERRSGFAQAVRLGNLLLLSGAVSWDDDGNVLDAEDMGAQMRNVYADIRRVLDEYKLQPEHIVKETLYTTDMEATLQVTDVRAEFYNGAPPPACTWVEVKRLVHPDLLIEIELLVELPGEP